MSIKIKQSTRDKIDEKLVQLYRKHRIHSDDPSNKEIRTAQGGPVHAELTAWLKVNRNVVDWESLASDILSKDIQQRRPLVDGSLNMFEQDDEALIPISYEGDELMLKDAGERHFIKWAAIITKQQTDHTRKSMLKLQAIDEVMAEFDKRPKCKTLNDLKKERQKEAKAEVDAEMAKVR